VLFWLKCDGNEFKGVLSIVHPRGIPNPHTSEMMQFEGQQFEHWATAQSHSQYHLCVAKHKCTATKFQCTKCKVGLCLPTCCRIYHNEVHFWSM